MSLSKVARPGLKPSRLCYIGAAGLMLLVFAWPALAQSGAALCDRAAQNAARTHGVPLEILRTVALLETGRKQGDRLRPWPWALNAGGTSHWLDSKADAAAKARAILATGRRNLDFGCFQLNYHWHGASFASIEDMLDPAQNADYAARYLQSHFQRLGDWKAAVGAYHSRTPKYAARYLARYETVAKHLGPLPQGGSSPQMPPARGPNGFMLLSGGGRGALGSLVPVAVLDGAAPLIPQSGGTR